jgi:hypothetical protein
MIYNSRVTLIWGRFLLAFGLICLAQGCLHEIPAEPEVGSSQSNLAVGRALAVLTGERSRIYQPTVRSFEIQNKDTGDRFQVEIKSDDEQFFLPLAPGHYELIRVQISEGPFLSMAELASTFSIGRDPVTYLGTWRFAVDSPKYGRMVSISMVNDEDHREQAVQSIAQKYPSMDHALLTTVLPDPPQAQARLFEVMPYPRVSRYFRRHWW